MTRSDRGERRRDALLDAAAALLKQEGFAAVSHRAVATRAGLPLAATTYYFRNLDDLVEGATRRLAEDTVAPGRELVAALPHSPLEPARLAELIVRVVAGNGDRAQLLTVYERYAQAGRRPGLRPVVRAWTQDLVDLVAESLRRTGRDAGHARRLVALADGLLLQHLADEEDGGATAAAAADLAGILHAAGP